jgi:hypothetical protein
MSSEESVARLPDEGNANIGQRDSGTWWFLRRARARLDKTGHTKP